MLILVETETTLALRGPTRGVRPTGRFPNGVTELGRLNCADGDPTLWGEGGLGAVNPLTCCLSPAFFRVTEASSRPQGAGARRSYAVALVIAAATSGWSWSRTV
jgi:hypothetical protein